MTYIKEVTLDELLILPNIDSIIMEYANTNINPLVQNVDPTLFIPAVKNAFMQKAKNENLKFNVLIDSNNQVQGFLIYSLYVNGNCPDLIADVQSIYVTPIFRHKGWGIKIMKTLFKQAKSYGARGVYMSAPYNSRLSNALSRMFKPAYVNYFREL